MRNNFYWAEFRTKTIGDMPIRSWCEVTSIECDFYLVRNCAIEEQHCHSVKLIFIISISHQGLMAPYGVVSNFQYYYRIRYNSNKTLSIQISTGAKLPPSNSFHSSSKKWKVGHSNSKHPYSICYFEKISSDMEGRVFQNSVKIASRGN